MDGYVDRQALQDIADAIREKNGSSDTYTPSEMAEAIRSIEGGGEGFDLVSAGLPQEYQDKFNAHYKNGIEYAKYIKQTLDGASESVAGLFRNDMSVVFVPELNLENVTGAGNLFNGCINLEHSEKITFNKYKLGNSQIFMDCVRLSKIHLHFKNGFSWHGNAIMGCPNLREVYIDDISRLTSNIGITGTHKNIKIYNTSKWTKMNMTLQYTPVLIPLSIRYIIWHALNGENSLGFENEGATSRTLQLHATPYASWEEWKTTKPSVEDCEFLGVDETEITKYGELTWEDIALSIKLITIGA